MSPQASGVSNLISRGSSFRLWAGVGFVVVVAGLLAYLLPSPADWRRSITTFASRILADPPKSQPATRAGDQVVWMSIAPEKQKPRAPGNPVLLSISSVERGYSLGDIIRLEVRNNDAKAAWYSCSVEQHWPAGWLKVDLLVTAPASACTPRMNLIPPGESITIRWNPAAENHAGRESLRKADLKLEKGEEWLQIEPGEYRFAVAGWRDGNADQDSRIEIRTEPFVLK